MWLGLATTTHAQGAPLETGREVRLFVRGVAQVFEGTMTAVGPETLAVTLRDGSSFTLSPAQIERSQVRVPRPNMRFGAILGGAVGLGVGVVLVVTSRDRCAGGFGVGSTDCGSAFDGAKLIVPSIAGVVAGAVVGRFVRTPRWVPGILPAASGAGGLAFRWAVSLS
jgi:hypothetical protein